MRFRGRITNVFDFPGQEGLAVVLTEIEGMPAVGMSVRLFGRRARILELGRNSTDGQPVSRRDCLTGREVAPYGGVLVEWEGKRPKATRDDPQWLEEEPDT